MQTATRLPDCFCDGRTPRCPICVVAIAVRLRLDHIETLSVSMLKRRIPEITGREAAYLVEATRNMKPKHNRRNGGYVESSPAGA